MSIHEKLQQLYLCDQQLRGIRKRLDSASSRLKSQQSKLGQLGSQRQEIASQLKSAQVKASTGEGQMKDLDQKIDHLREQMNHVKNNKEYSAFLIEVSTFKNEKDKLEEVVLGQMGQVDRLVRELKEVEGKYLEQEKVVAAAQAEVDIRGAEIRDQLEEITSKRAMAEGAVPSDARTIFNKLLYLHEGEAMATVVEENRRYNEYSCGGCCISIPVERVSGLMNRQEEIICCPNCGRILYLDEEFKASMDVGE
jgi:predicted  nucleic acid-binding Zn-ribbon protein